MNIKSLLTLLIACALGAFFTGCVVDENDSNPAGFCQISNDSSEGVGTACLASSDCNDGLDCYSDTGTPPGICVQGCATDAECGDGGTCVLLDNTSNNNTNTNNSTTSTNNSTTSTNNSTTSTNNSSTGTNNSSTGTNNSTTSTNNSTTSTNNGSTGGGGDSCAEMIGCFNDCGQEDQACAEACFNAASPTAQQQYFDIIDCAEANCPEFDNACLEQSCGGELNACFGGGNPNNSTGGGDLLCLTDCGSDADCPGAQTCADVTGQGNFQCIEGNAVPADAPECSDTGECAAGQTCYQVGGGGGGGGSDTCGGMVECFNGCGQDDQACLEACFNAASPEAQQQYFDIIDCGEANCPDFDNACLEENCLDELSACFGG